MSDPTIDNDIDALLRDLGYSASCGYKPWRHAALTALVAERNKAKADFSEAWRERSEFAKRIDEADGAIFAVVAERNALRKRVAELEAHPPADRDLRERLVCAIWPVILRQWREYKDAIDPRGCARSDALEEADKMIAAMRKGEAHGK